MRNLELTNFYVVHQRWGRVGWVEGWGRLMRLKVETAVCNKSVKTLRNVDASVCCFLTLNSSSGGVSSGGALSQGQNHCGHTAVCLKLRG